MIGITKRTTTAANPAANMREPAPGTSKLAAFEASSGPLPDRPVEWTDAQVSGYCKALAGDILEAFDSREDASWKSALLLANRAMDSGVPEFEIRAGFSGTRFGIREEAFLLTIRVFDDPAADGPAADGPASAENSADARREILEAAEGLLEPAERIASVMDDHNGIRNVWDCLARAFPDAEAGDLASACACALVVMEGMSDANAADMDLALDGMFRGDPSSPEETGKSSSITGRRTEIAFGQTHAPRRSPRH